MGFALRIFLFFLGFSALAQLLFAFDHLESLRTIYNVSTPHINAFYRGLLVSRYIDVGLVLVGFLFRRTIKIVVTRLVTIGATVLLPVRLRRAIESLSAWPKRYIKMGYSKLRVWCDYTFGLCGALWIASAVYGWLFFVAVLVGLETAVAIIRGVIMLPPTLLEYKVQVVTGIGSLALGTFSQQFILLVWRQVSTLVPKAVSEFSERYKTRSFRHAVRARVRLGKLVRIRPVRPK